MNRPLPRRLRMLIGGLIILAWLVFYVVAAATVGGWLVGSAIWAQVIYYVVAGFGWVAPLKPLIAWMSKDDASAT